MGDFDIPSMIGVHWCNSVDFRVFLALIDTIWNKVALYCSSILQDINKS